MTNAEEFFGAIKSPVTTWLNSGLDIFIIPVAILILGIIAIVKIAQAAIDHRRGQGDDLMARLTPAIICIIIIAVLLTKNAWWGFLVGAGA
ncbi:MAG TPA: hypothetical protein H9773_07200 [Candidatus Fournierella merdavium]|nr:hypothetical protein [Candidatus Fournierella merdavium]